MAQRSMARRPPVRKPAPAPSAPAQVLAHRSATHLRDGLALVGVGGVGYGAASLTGHPQWDLPALVLGVGGGAAVAVTGQRAKLRNELQDRLVEALAPHLGVRQLDRRTVRFRGWTSGWPGLPRRIVIRYAPGAPDTDPLWKPGIIGAITGRLLAKYEVVNHDPLKCRITLQLVPASAFASAEPPYSQVRAERAITELIGVTAKVSEAELDGDELCSITVTHQAGAKLAASGYRSRIERVISTMMPGRWRAVWDLEGDSVRFEVRPHLPASVWLPGEVPDHVEDLLANYRQVRIPFGVDEDGVELAWYPARAPQLLLVGGTGTGKTSTAHAILASFAAYGWPAWVCDAKRVEFLEFRDWPNVQIVAGSVPHQVAVIHRAWELMEHRYELIESGRARVTDFEPLVVFLDEYAEFVAGLLEWYPTIKAKKGAPTKPPTLSQVASLARKARTARIHLVVSMQRPDIALLGGATGEMRDNFGQRISMGRLSPQGAMMMWENPSTGVSLPRSCIGRATATNDEGRAVEMQCYRFPEWDAPEGSDQRTLLNRLRPAEVRHPRLLIVPPQDDQEQDLDTGEVIEPTFWDYARADWVLADSRPDLDPLSEQNRISGQDGRALSSTLASLGLGESPAPRSRRYEETFAAIANCVDEVDDSPSWSDRMDDEYAGYASASSCYPRHLVLGDLIQVDQDGDDWVVVDESPEDDLAAPGMIAISWRGDGDESGSISIPDDTEVPVRRPEEDA